MIAIIDYGAGNLRSVQKALEKSTPDVRVTQDPKTILRAKGVVLPGVGAIKPAKQKLDSLELTSVIKEVINRSAPFLGICVGFQLLFEKSTEGGDAKGLGIFKGTVERFTIGKVPQIGWNQLNIQNKSCPLFKDIPDSSFVYFCHSYFARPEEKAIISTITDYGAPYASSVFKNNVFGVQFHPEKSQTVGLQILKNFTEICQ